MVGQTFKKSEIGISQENCSRCISSMGTYACWLVLLPPLLFFFLCVCTHSSVLGILSERGAWLCPAQQVRAQKLHPAVMWWCLYQTALTAHELNSLLVYSKLIKHVACPNNLQTQHQVWSRVRAQKPCRVVMWWCLLSNSPCFTQTRSWMAYCSLVYSKFRYFYIFLENLSNNSSKQLHTWHCTSLSAQQYIQQVWSTLDERFLRYAEDT